MCGCNPRRSVDDAIVLGGVRFNWKFSSMQSEKKIKVVVRGKEGLALRPLLSVFNIDVDWCNDFRRVVPCRCRFASIRVCSMMLVKKVVVRRES
ncbi:unnamed protein product [Ectocarpus sp. 12 AP-2014]